MCTEHYEKGWENGMIDSHSGKSLSRPRVSSKPARQKRSTAPKTVPCHAVWKTPCVFIFGRTFTVGDGYRTAEALRSKRAERRRDLRTSRSPANLQEHVVTSKNVTVVGGAVRYCQGTTHT